MNINYKESQIDFLSHVASKAQDAAPPRYMAAQISLSLENLVILSIAAIMVVIFSFALGIERGKKVALAVPAAAVSDDMNVASGSSAGVGKVDKASEKTDVKDALDAPKGQVVSSQLLVKAAAIAVRGTSQLAQKPQSAIKADAASPASGSFTLQVASYKNAQPAQREADKLKQKGFRDVYVLPKGTYVIVCVGNFQKKEDASGVKRQLKSRYQDFVVRRL